MIFLCALSVATSLIAEPIQIMIPSGCEPAAFAAGELRDALAERRTEVNVHTWADGDKKMIAVVARRYPLPAMAVSEMNAEDYVFEPYSAGVVCKGGGEIGLMYALLDLAERVRMKGIAGAFPNKAETHTPAIEVRAVNPFLSIPRADAEGKRDWEHWWFTDEEFWRGYLDLLARARINLLDLHGMYDLQTTRFPNMWPYFVVSKKYPDVGMEPAQAEKNMQMLAKVCTMAKQRGIRVGIMNYTGGWNWPGCRQAPERSVDDFISYTKEGLKQIIERCPDLAMIGFRIGESGYGEDFYAKSYVAALEEMGRPLPLYTRTWGAKKEKLMELGAMYPDKFLIEIKYNGEQMGPPWHLAGGRMAGWRDYSYQDYLFYPRQYKVIWQIRANGTNRVFQWADYEHIRACVKTTNLAGSVGFTVEPFCTYYPMDDFLHPEPMFRWEYERNPLWYLMWGRLGYDPGTTEDLFRMEAKRQWGGKHGDAAYRLLQSMSRILPTIKTQFSLGPDHRDHAPELEWGGSIRQWARALPFDTYFAMGCAEYAREVTTGNFTGRRTPVQAAEMLERMAAETEGRQRAIPSGASKSLDDLKTDARMLVLLARYYATRLRAATEYALAEVTSDRKRVEAARELTAKSKAAWVALAEEGDRHFRPIIDRLRMHTETYQWSQSVKLFDQDEKDFVAMPVSDKPPGVQNRPMGDGANIRVSVEVTAVDRLRGEQTVEVAARISGLGRDERIMAVRLLSKPFRSEADWTRDAMQLSGDAWRASLHVAPQGVLYGVEVITNRSMFFARIDGAYPYGAIDPWAP
ncbi:MAG: hypothetical protein HRF45_01165 [Fimbriimonadia bacterium]